MNGRFHKIHTSAQMGLPAHENCPEMLATPAPESTTGVSGSIIDIGLTQIQNWLPA